MAVDHLDAILSAKPLIPTGGLLRGETTSPLPTDATTAPDATFMPLGYVTDKGVSLTSNVSTTDRKAWGGQVVRVLSTDVAVEMTFELFERMNPDAARAVYGKDNVAETANGIAIKFSGQLPDPAPYIIEAKDQGGKRIRAVIPRFQVTDQGDTVFDDNATMDMSIKGKAYPDDTGQYYYLYVEKSAA